MGQPEQKNPRLRSCCSTNWSCLKVPDSSMISCICSIFIIQFPSVNFSVQLIYIVFVYFPGGNNLFCSFYFSQLACCTSVHIATAPQCIQLLHLSTYSYCTSVHIAAATQCIQPLHLSAYSRCNSVHIAAAPQ